MTRLPLSVIGGYLGAGKTTLINELLSYDHGLRLAVLVNDFGSINIDAALLQSASEDTIELTNGCVCCTMSGDLFFAIGDLLERVPRPDHILVEASGISDPSRVAIVAVAEPDLEYSGIIAVADGWNLLGHLSDPRISAQVAQQLQCADLVAISKTDCNDVTVAGSLESIGVTRKVSAGNLAAIAATIFRPAPPPKTPADDVHPSYVQWSHPTPAPLRKSEIQDRLARRPSNLIRLKALLPGKDGQFWEVHVVGQRTEIKERQNASATGIVAIGLEGNLSKQDICRWWQGS